MKVNITIHVKDDMHKQFSYIITKALCRVAEGIVKSGLENRTGALLLDDSSPVGRYDMEIEEFPPALYSIRINQIEEEEKEC